MADEDQPEWGKKISKYCFVPQRIVLSLMCMFCIVNCYTCRISLNQAITVMVVKEHKNKSTESAICEPDEDTDIGKLFHEADKEWSEAVQGQVLGFFYLGYLLSHLPGGILADKFGGKWVLIIGMALNGITSILTPLSIDLADVVGVIIMRVFMGVGQGVAFPAVSGMLASWLPVQERGKLGALAMGGAVLGSIFGNLFSGIILNSLKWPMLFYIYGFCTLLWALFFFLMCFSYPSTHPYIKESEKNYLIQEMGSIGKKKKPPFPVCGIFKNVPMWALISAQIGHDWGLFVVVTDLPKYMSDVLQMSILKNGAYSSLPWLLYWLVSIIMGFVGDALITKHVLSITNVRKIMTAVAAFGPGFFLVLASYAECNKAMVIAFFSIAMGTMGPYMVGMKLSPLDMSPNFAGTLMAITNGIGAITGYIAPALVGVMTPNSSLTEWRYCFWLAFFMLGVTAIVYCIWASGEIQPFNSPEDAVAYEAKKQKKKEEKEAKKAAAAAAAAK